MLIRNLKISGLLSFGPKGIDLPLEGLNVLIGPNGSGKSNLLEILALLRSAPTNLPAPVYAAHLLHQNRRFAMFWRSATMVDDSRWWTSESSMRLLLRERPSRTSSTGFRTEIRSSTNFRGNGAPAQT